MLSPRALAARLCSRGSMFQDLVQTLAVNLLVLVLTVIQMRWSRRWVHYGEEA